MNIIIEYGNTKRRIDGSFNIRGSSKDLELIEQAIREVIDSEGYVPEVTAKVAAPQPELCGTVFEWSE